MNKLFAGAAGLAVFVVLAGCASGAVGKNCGTDQDCLQTAMEACNPAYGTLDYPSSSPFAKLYTEVKGGSMSSCEYYFKVSEIVLSSGVSSSTKVLEGKEAVCKGASSTVNQMLSSLKGCSGSLVDFVNGSQSGTSSVPIPPSSSGDYPSTYY